MPVKRVFASAEAIDRCIRGNLLAAHGLTYPCVGQVIPVEQKSPDASGCNWKVASGAVPADCLDEVLAAATAAAVRLNLAGGAGQDEASVRH